MAAVAVTASSALEGAMAGAVPVVVASAGVLTEGEGLAWSPDPPHPEDNNATDSAVGISRRRRVDGADIDLRFVDEATTRPP